MAETTPTPISEISHGPSQFDAFLDRNQKKLVALAIVLALGVVGYLVFDGLQSMEKQKAGSKLFNAESAEEYKEASVGAPQNVQATAQLLRAKAQGADDLDGAMTTLKDLIATQPNSVVSKDAELSLALYQIEAGLNDEARQGLTNILADPEAEYTKVVAKVALADLELVSGNLEEAKNLFHQVDEVAEFAGFKSLSSAVADLAGVEDPEVVIKKEEVSKE